MPQRLTYYQRQVLTALAKKRETPSTLLASLKVHSESKPLAARQSARIAVTRLKQRGWVEETFEEPGPTYLEITDFGREILDEDQRREG